MVEEKRRVKGACLTLNAELLKTRGLGILLPDVVDDAILFFFECRLIVSFIRGNKIVCNERQITLN